MAKTRRLALRTQHRLQTRRASISICIYTHSPPTPSKGPYLKTTPGTPLRLPSLPNIPRNPLYLPSSLPSSRNLSLPELTSHCAAFKGASSEINDFYASETLEKSSLLLPPSAPKLDSARVVDGARSLTIFKPLPASSAGRKFEMRKRCLGVYDKGSVGSVLHTLHELMEEEEAYARIEVWSFYVGQGNWGGPRGPRMDSFPTPERDPDIVTTHQTTRETPLLYR